MQSLKNQFSQYWLFTINNPIAQDELDIDRAKQQSNYLVYQLECGENGTNHYQGYIEFTSRKRGTTVKGVLPRAHLERRRGTAEQAADYCKKDDTRLDGPWEYGTISNPTPGARNDHKAIKEAIDEGRSMVDLWRDDAHFGSMVRYYKGYYTYMNAVDPPRAFKTQVCIFIGSAGTGKSSLANKFPTPYVPAEATSSQFFDHYDPRHHKTVILDDYNGRIKFQTLLQMMDEHPYQVNVKGGKVNWKPDWLIICSNKHPDEWYVKASLDPRLWQAFNRRVNYRIDFYPPHQYYVTQQSVDALPTAVQTSLADNYTEYVPQEELYDVFN